MLLLRCSPLPSNITHVSLSCMQCSILPKYLITKHISCVSWLVPKSCGVEQTNEITVHMSSGSLSRSLKVSCVSLYVCGRACGHVLCNVCVCVYGSLLCVYLCVCSDFPPLYCEEERCRYKQVFNTEYEEYLQLKNDIDHVSNDYQTVCSALSERLHSVPKHTEEHRVMSDVKTTQLCLQRAIVVVYSTLLLCIAHYCCCV